MSHIEPEFPAMTAVDTVVREAQALVQRYRLLRRLEDDHGIRKDLRGVDPEPELVAEMVRQLVPGVDAPLANRQLTWPIPAGVRLETLHASPWLADVAGPMGLYTVPTTAEAFAAQFQARTGIEPESEAMDRNYRITPLELGHIAMELRGQARRPTLASLLLCSRHFAEAAAAAEANDNLVALYERRAGIRFRRPLVDGFRLLAELEREALLIQDLGRINLLSTRQIRRWLKSNNVMPLARALKKYPQLKQLFDYQMIGTDALGGFDNADAGGYVPLHRDLRVTAAARGQLDVDVVSALTQEGELARLTLLAAFPDPPAGTRANALSNDEPAFFYGLNTTLAGALQSDLGRAFQHGDDIGNAAGADHERQALLVSSIVAHADPALHARTVQRTVEIAKGASNKRANGISRQRDAQAHAQLILPKRRIVGSAPRADADLWNNRWGDAPLASALLNRQLGELGPGLNQAERSMIESAFARLDELFQRTFLAGCDANDTQGRKDAVHALCDMATGISAISTNRQISAAIQAWLSFYSQSSVSLSDIKDHGRRWLPGIRYVLRVRKKVGVPSLDKRDGTPRKDRSATRKRKALQASQQDADQNQKAPQSS